MKKILAALALLSLCSFARADVFKLGAGLTNLETVTVGDPGNAGELSGLGAGGHGYDSVCGSVSYSYNIGKYEVTAGQYCDFLNAKAKTSAYQLYDGSMGGTSGCGILRSGTSGSYSYSVASDYANRPVNYVSFWDACRFANWLGNGQGGGDTETGAYTLNGYNSYDGRTIQRNAGWKWAVTSEDEWYKAAYYRGGTDAGYWDYPTQSNTAPSNVLGDPTDPGNNATYYKPGGGGYTLGSPYWRTEVGAHENSESPYGTFDQGGNVYEWNEALVNGGDSGRGVRGGTFGTSDTNLKASYRGNSLADSQNAGSGFRVVQVVPEPSSIIAMVGGLASLLGMRRRRV